MFLMPRRRSYPTSSECTYILANSSGAYLHGEVVAGSIILKTTKEKDIRDIVLNFNGRLKIRWEEEIKLFFETVTVVVSTNKTFTNQTMWIRSQGILPAGTYHYHFRFKTNKNCLSSYEGPFGHIRYELSLIINKYFGNNNVFKKAVTVINRFDLNLSESCAPAPVDTKSNEVSISTSFFSSRTVYFTLQTNFIAYAPGQNIKYSILIHNLGRTKFTILSCCLHLVKRVIFRCRTPFESSKTTDTKIAKEDHLEQRATENLIQGEMRIPTTSPTTSRSDDIYVRYYLEASMTLGLSKTIKLNAEHNIVIGTLPLRKSMPLVKDPYNKDAAPYYAPIKSPTFEPDTEFTPFIDREFPEINRIEYRPLYPTFSIDRY